MLYKLFLLFTIIPILDVLLLFKVSAFLGGLSTLLLVLLTGISGAALARFQGLRTLHDIRQSLAQGELPTRPLADGAMILVAATMLLTPGLLTDLFGFSLLIPPFRSFLRTATLRYLERHMLMVHQSTPSDDVFFSTRPSRYSSPEVIDIDPSDLQED